MSKFAKIGLTFDYDFFRVNGQGTIKLTIDSQEMTPVKMDAIFKISVLKNPGVPNFIKIGQIFNFGDFLGDPVFLAKKSSEKNFDVIFGFSTFERHQKPIYSKIGQQLDVD